MNFDPDLIKKFVRDELGCSCQDEVFYNIKFQNHVELEHKFFIDKAVTVGNRLLIFILNVTTGIKIEKSVEKLVNHGRNWRDSEELNRFRLVLITTTPDTLEKKIKNKFKKLVKDDEKIHLHIINRKILVKNNYGFLIE